jgi:hypothetical protein
MTTKSITVMNTLTAGIRQPMIISIHIHIANLTGFHTLPWIPHSFDSKLLSVLKRRKKQIMLIMIIIT